MKEIQFRDAKASPSAVLDDAVQGEPSIITRYGPRVPRRIAHAKFQPPVVRAKLLKAIKFDPRIASADALDYSVEDAKHVKEWPVLEKAVDAKIDEKEKFMASGERTSLMS